MEAPQSEFPYPRRRAIRAVLRRMAHMAMEVMTGAWEDRAVFVATLRRCARSLEKFGAEVRLLEILASGGKEETASSVAAMVWDAKRE